MSNSARNIVNWINASIRSLSFNPDYGTLDAVYTELSKQSGVSKSAIIKLYSGESRNPTVDTVDKLVAAVKAALLRVAA